MSKDKQIEEMYNIMSKAIRVDCSAAPIVPESGGICDYLDCRSCKQARFLINAGYRKQSEVAREIFEDIDKVISEQYPIYTVDSIIKGIAELKKKYTEDTNG